MISEIRLRKLIKEALHEDIGPGDATTSALISEEERARGVVVAKEAGVLAGVDVAAKVFSTMDPGCKTSIWKKDGERIGVGETIMVVEGRASPMLSAERVALNFLQRMSGIATETARYVEAVRGLPVRILDTRKTSPGLRMLEKHAVRMGGGFNHRFGLFDGILIKDNHLSVLRGRGVGCGDAVRMAKSRKTHAVNVEVEATNLDQVREAIEAGADAVLLDNMDVEEIEAAVKLAGGRVILEASGGINLDNVRRVAETGVNLISIGAITHSAPSLDISLE
ncbi:MAG: carboxylating nicotinate-nucleotide diphosphorylase, partial [Candidatus Brockarchaeota archaeon]|nr:carboxylating nicotinate-nucleotide diphosphorylase [Candidatus Brockarchaeota archaeon]